MVGLRSGQRQLFGLCTLLLLAACQLLLDIVALPATPQLREDKAFTKAELPLPRLRRSWVTLLYWVPVALLAVAALPSALMPRRAPLQRLHKLTQDLFSLVPCSAYSLLQHGLLLVMALTPAARPSPSRVHEHLATFPVTRLVCSALFPFSLQAEVAWLVVDLLLTALLCGIYLHIYPSLAPTLLRHYLLTMASAAFTVVLHVRRRHAPLHGGSCQPQSAAARDETAALAVPPEGLAKAVASASADDSACADDSRGAVTAAAEASAADHPCTPVNANNPNQRAAASRCTKTACAADIKGRAKTCTLASISPSSDVARRMQQAAAVAAGGRNYVSHRPHHMFRFKANDYHVTDLSPDWVTHVAHLLEERHGLMLVSAAAREGCIELTIDVVPFGRPTAPGQGLLHLDEMGDSGGHEVQATLLRECAAAALGLLPPAASGVRVSPCTMLPGAASAEALPPPPGVEPRVLLAARGSGVGHGVGGQPPALALRVQLQQLPVPATGHASASLGEDSTLGFREGGVSSVRMGEWELEVRAAGCTSVPPFTLAATLELHQSASPRQQQQAMEVQLQLLGGPPPVGLLLLEARPVRSGSDADACGSALPVPLLALDDEAVVSELSRFVAVACREDGPEAADDLLRDLGIWLAYAEQRLLVAAAAGEAGAAAASPLVSMGVKGRHSMQLLAADLLRFLCGCGLAATARRMVADVAALSMLDPRVLDPNPAPAGKEARARSSSNHNVPQVTGSADVAVMLITDMVGRDGLLRAALRSRSPVMVARVLSWQLGWAMVRAASVLVRAAAWPRRLPGAAAATVQGTAAPALGQGASAAAAPAPKLPAFWQMALLQALGLGRQGADAEALYRPYAAQVVASLGHVIQLMDLVCLVALVLRRGTRVASAENFVSLVATCASLLTASAWLMQTPRAWARTMQGSMLPRHVCYVLAPALITCAGFPVPPGIHAFHAGLGTWIMDGVIIPASCVVPPATMLLMALLKLPIKARLYIDACAAGACHYSPWTNGLRAVGMTCLSVAVNVSMHAYMRMRHMRQVATECRRRRLKGGEAKAD